MIRFACGSSKMEAGMNEAPPSLVQPMQAHESPTEFVMRAYSAMMSELDPAHVVRLAATLLHPRFSMHADGHALDRESFLLRTQHLRQRLTKPPVFSWTKTAESAVVDGRAVVSSVHSVFMEFANGAANHTDYISMIEIDMTSGTLIHCDELSRLTSITAPTIGDCCSRIDHPTSAPVSGRWMGKRTRSLNDLTALEAQEARAGVVPRMTGVPLKRAGVADLACFFPADLTPGGLHDRPSAAASVDQSLTSRPASSGSIEALARGGNHQDATHALCAPFSMTSLGSDVASVPPASSSWR